MLLSRKSPRTGALLLTTTYGLGILDTPRELAYDELEHRGSDPSAGLPIAAVLTNLTASDKRLHYEYCNRRLSTVGSHRVHGLFRKRISMKTHLFTALAVGLFLGADAPSDDVKKEKAKLQGTWKALRVEEGGNAKDDSKDHRLIFSGDEFSIKGGDQTIIKGKFKIESSKNPKQIDMELVETPKEEQKGKTVHGIYALDGDTLKFCANEPGADERPKEFSAPAGSKHFFVTLKREKP
jgi:uncharacterized protein (TIGR03067 family)